MSNKGGERGGGEGSHVLGVLTANNIYSCRKFTHDLVLISFSHFLFQGSSYFRFPWAAIRLEGYGWCGWLQLPLKYIACTNHALPTQCFKGSKNQGLINPLEACKPGHNQHRWGSALILKIGHKQPSSRCAWTFQLLELLTGMAEGC